eukprot:gnl/TRDRNA2_/TRDRNA2_63734_c0_seq1.p1 gnl/TRDRNA2_/TRDRNA2_63734_c0~~gnl/TRDRNA2_/TRDRNA2_63734_c0_seq1.p1  ORF type:complete len:191 (+),score=40.04 gnl/TRDRNA2_/TRDRNA2_63734_c0_seq1:74-646(+)
MRCTAILFSYAVAAARAAVLADPDEAVCLPGFAGQTNEERCQSALNFVNEGQAPQRRRNVTSAGSHKVEDSAAARKDKKLRVQVLVAKTKGEMDDKECKESCEEDADETETDSSGVFLKVKCCHTVRRKLAKYKATEARCAEKTKHESPCWQSLQETLPSFIEHYQKLQDECDAECPAGWRAKDPCDECD